MLEEIAKELIAALKANTAALTGKAPVAEKTKTAVAGKSTVTFDQVKAAVVKVKDTLGKPKALKIIKEDGAAAELAAIKPARFAAVVAACAEALAETQDDPEEAEADDDM